MNYKQSSPFTLLEVVLAVTIFAVMSGLTAMILYAMPHNWSNMQERADRLAALTRLDSIADRAIRNAVPFEWTEKLRDDRLIFSGDPQRLVIAYRKPIEPGSGSGIGFLALGFRDGKLLAQYRDQPIVYWEEETLPGTLTEEIILEDVKEFNFRYAKWENGKLEWDEDWEENSNKLFPPAIAWDIEFEDGQKVSYLRRTAGNSFYTSYGRRNENKRR